MAQPGLVLVEVGAGALLRFPAADAGGGQGGGPIPLRRREAQPGLVAVDVGLRLTIDCRCSAAWLSTARSEACPSVTSASACANAAR